MELNATTQANAKAFAVQLRSIRDKIVADEFAIDNSGDSLRAIVGMVVQSLGSDVYEGARAKVDAASGEKGKIVVLLDRVLDHIDQLNAMNDQTLSLAQQLGVSGIKWV